MKIDIEILNQKIINTNLVNFRISVSGHIKRRINTDGIYKFIMKI